MYSDVTKQNHRAWHVQMYMYSMHPDETIPEWPFCDMICYANNPSKLFCLFSYSLWTHKAELYDNACFICDNKWTV